ncbi:hypothetical protein B0H63DRAFT_21095 [Podospora didyma]|uniref:Uncharacterized protein n=1 Tax=Podospora didyma TaxID=330526 RepID=A0AAE0U799_9PEZI|nr:hypothetical protein B0H63DRAFT_21095 [Podospora didyma]
MSKAAIFFHVDRSIAPLHNAYTRFSFYAEHYRQGRDKRKSQACKKPCGPPSGRDEACDYSSVSQGCHARHDKRSKKTEGEIPDKINTLTHSRATPQAAGVRADHGPLSTPRLIRAPGSRECQPADGRPPGTRLPPRCDAFKVSDRGPNLVLPSALKAQSGPVAEGPPREGKCVVYTICELVCSTLHQQTLPTSSLSLPSSRR